MKPILLVAALAAAFSTQAANVVVTPGGVAGYLYLNQQSAGASGAATPIDCNAGFVSDYTNTFVAGDITQDIVVNYWMKGGGGGGSVGNGGNGASVSSSFTIPSGYTGTLKVYVGRGGGTGVMLGTDIYAGGNGGGGYGGGGGGGHGQGSGVGGPPHYTNPGGGGGGSSAILLGTSRIAIAGGGGGGGMATHGGSGVGASGGGGGGSRNWGPPAIATDVKGGVWNGVDPASSGGAGNVSQVTSPMSSPCSSSTLYYGLSGGGGTNGGGGGGGGGALHGLWTGSSCYRAASGGGGGGGGAGGGGGGNGVDTSLASSWTNPVGGNGGTAGFGGIDAPALLSAPVHIGGRGGGAGGGGGGNGGNRHLPGGGPQAGPGTYAMADPFIFLSDKGVGGKGAYETSPDPARAGTSGGVFVRYSATKCVIKQPF